MNQFLAITGVVASLLGSSLGLSTASGGPKPGDAPPPFTLEKLLQAPPVAEASWSSLRGKVVVLEFWATWYGPCVGAIRHMNELSDRFKDRPVQFIAITDEEEKIIRPFLQRKPIHGWVGLDPDGSMLKAYQVTGIPHTVIVGTNGLIAAITHPSLLGASHLELILTGRPADFPSSNLSENESVPPVRIPSGEKEDELPVFQVVIQPSQALNASSSSGGAGRNSLGSSYGYNFLGSTVWDTLPIAYEINSTRILTNAPLPAGKFDFFLKLPTSRSQDISALLRQALETTFSLKARRETREMDVYLLKVARRKAKGLVTTATPNTASTRTGLGLIEGINMRIESLVWTLESRLQRPVCDETGLEGGYDVTIEWDQIRGSSPSPDGLIRALDQYCGLKVVPSRRSVEVLTVAVDIPERAAKKEGRCCQLTILH